MLEIKMQGNNLNSERRLRYIKWDIKCEVVNYTNNVVHCNLGSLLQPGSKILQSKVWSAQSRVGVDQETRQDQDNPSVAN